MRIYLTLALALALSGCKKAPPGGAGLDQINDRFNAAGLKVDPFVPTDAARFSATRCLAGRIEGVDATVCEYGSAEASRLGRKAAEDWIGTAATGATLENGRVLLVLADRARSDPNGKGIQRISLAFQGKR